MCQLTEKDIETVRKRKNDLETGELASAVKEAEEYENKENEMCTSVHRTPHCSLTPRK